MSACASTRSSCPNSSVFAQIDGVQVYDLDALDDWVRSTDTGDLEELPFVLDAQTRRPTSPAPPTNACTTNASTMTAAL